MRVRADPTMRDWAVSQTAAVWTGHQPWLWHPGILAKYLALDALSEKKTSPVNVVVDHDTQNPLRLELPVRQGDALSVLKLSLAPVRPDVPPACQAPVKTDAVIHVLRTLPTNVTADVTRLIEAFGHETVQQADMLGTQMAAVLEVLLAPWIKHEIKHVFSSALFREPWFPDELHALLSDAPRAARHYNAAVAQHSSAGVAPLRIEPDRVELPVWLLQWETPRRRLFADVADSEPWLVTEDGERINPAKAWLAPKALWMTALLRRQTEHCAGFIHGTGGGGYDRAMEAWWSAWRDEPLAPQAVVTADATLTLDAPVHDHTALDRAVWHKHHLPHNLDRAPGVAAAHSELIEEKKQLLGTMDQDRAKPRRRAAFDRLHAINAALARAHHGLIDQADAELTRTRAGVANADIAGKRDWCFSLYPTSVLQELRNTVGRTIR